MPQLPTPRPSQPPKQVQVYGPPSPPKRAVPQPTPTKPVPQQYDPGVDSTGPQQRRVGGSYEAQAEIDSFPTLDAIRQHPLYATLDEAQRKRLEQNYHGQITRNTTAYKSDATKGQQGDERSQDRTAQREARMQGNRNVEYVRRGMGLDGLPEYVTDDRATSQSRVGNVIGNIYNNSLLGKYMEAVTGQPPIRTSEAQGGWEQAAELGGNVATGIADFLTAGGIARRLAGGAAKSLLSRGAIGSALEQIPGVLGRNMADDIAGGVGRLAQGAMGNMVPQTPAIWNQALQRIQSGEQTPGEASRDAMTSMGVAAGTGALMEPVANLIPGKGFLGTMARNAAQTGVGAIDMVSQGQTPNMQSLLTDFATGLAFDAPDIQIRTPAWTQKLFNPQTGKPVDQHVSGLLPSGGAVETGTTRSQQGPDLSTLRQASEQIGPIVGMGRRAMPVGPVRPEAHRSVDPTDPAILREAQRRLAGQNEVRSNMETASRQALPPGQEGPTLDALQQASREMGPITGIGRRAIVAGPAQTPEVRLEDLQAAREQLGPVPPMVPQVRPEQGVANPPTLPVPSTVGRPAAPKPDPLNTRNNLLLQKSTIESALATGRLSKTDTANATRALNKVNKQLAASGTLPESPATQAAGMATLTSSEAEARAAARAVQGNPVRPLPNDIPRPEVPNVAPEAPVAKAPKARKPKVTNNPPKPPVVQAPVVTVPPTPVPTPPTTKSKTKTKPAAKPEPKVEATQSAYSIGDHFKDEDGNIYKVTGVDSSGTVTAKLRQTKVATLQDMVGKEVDFDPDMMTGITKVDNPSDAPTNPVQRTAGEMKPLKGGRKSAKGQGGFIDPLSLDDVTTLGKMAGEAAVKGAKAMVNGFERGARALSEPVMRQLGFKIETGKDGESHVVYKPDPDAMGVKAIKATRGFIMTHILKPELRAAVNNWFTKNVLPVWQKVEPYAKMARDRFDDSTFRNSKAYQIYEQAKIEANQYRQYFMDILPKMAELSSDDLTTLNKVLTGEMDDAAYRAIAAPIRAKIDELSEMLHSVGMLTDDMYERGKGSYMRRVYDDKGDPVKLTTDLKKAPLMLRMMANVYKARGKWVTPPEAFPPSKTFDNLTKVGVSKNGNDLYKWTDGKVYERRGDQLWRDWTPEERAKMGEVTNAAYNVGNTLVTMAKNYETGKFYADVAKDKSMSRSIKDLTASELTDLQAKGWVNVNKLRPGNLGDSSIAKAGHLKGHIVAPEIAQFMKAQNAFGTRSEFGKLVQRIIVKPWKVGKTALHLVTHVNNIMTNMVLYDMHDGNWEHLGDALKAVSGHGKGDIQAKFELARSLGVFGDSFAAQELQKIAKAGYDLSAFRSKDAGPKTMLQRVKAIADWGRDFKRADAKGKTAMALKKGADGIEAMKTIYGAEDDVFRFAMFLDRLDRGQDPKVAAKAARDGFINYDIHAPGIIAMKNTLWPFISFAYRAWPLAAKLYADKPWKVIKHASMIGMAQAVGSMLNDAFAPAGSSGEDEERAAADWGVEGGTKIRLPFRDSNNNSRYLEVGKWNPLSGSLDSNGETASPVNIPQVLMPGGPAAIPFELFFNNRLTPWGPEEIVNKDKTTGDQLWDLGAYAAKQALPGSVGQGWNVYKAWSGKNTPGGKNETVGGAIAGMALKTTPVSPQDEIAKKARILKGRMSGYDDIVDQERKRVMRGEGSPSGLQSTAVEYNQLKQQAAQNFGEYLRRIKAAKGASK